MASLRESLINALGGVKRPDAPVLPPMEGGMPLPELPPDMAQAPVQTQLPEQEMANSGQFTPEEFRNIFVKGADGQALTTAPEVKPEFKDSFLGKFLKGAGNALGEEMAASALGPSMGRAVSMLTGGNLNLVPSRKPNELFNADFNTLNPSQQEFVTKNYGDYLTKLSSQQGLGLGGMDPKSEQFKELTRWMAASKDVDDTLGKINFAIENKDPSVIAQAVNKLAGIASVAVQQGVVSDEEARRVLSGVMSNFGQVEASGFDIASVQRFLNSDTWKSARNMAATVNDGLKARMRTYKDVFRMPEGFFNSAGINIAPNQNPEGSLNKEDVINQELLDAANLKAAEKTAEIRGRALGKGVPAAVGGALDEAGKKLNEKFGAKPYKPQPGRKHF